MVGTELCLDIGKAKFTKQSPPPKKSVFSIVDAQTWDFILCLNISSRTQVGNYDGIHHTPYNFTYLKKKQYSLSVVNIMFKK